MHMLAEILGEMGTLEQFRGGSPQRPPIIAFRFKDSPRELAALLTTWVVEFPGELRWHFNPNGPGINWVLGPQRIWDYTVEHQLRGELEAVVRLAEEDPEFCRRANAELSRLAEYLRECWRRRNAES
jgi:hypothetical protein